MSSSFSLTVVGEQRSTLLAEIAAIEEFRPGSLVERYRRCGKPSCRCAREGEPEHGPSWSLTRGVKGKTVTKVIPADFVDATLEQIDRHKRLQRLLHEYTQLNVKICDARAYYHCAGCGHGFFPRDEALRIGGGALSGRGTAWLAQLPRC